MQQTVLAGRGTGTGTELSPSMEDYLRAIYLVGQREGGVTTSGLASQLGVSSPSVTNMIRRLRQLGLVQHERYRPFALTEEGSRRARALARRHRLLQYYLVKTLGFSWEDAAIEADQLEHVASAQLEGRMTDRLDQIKDVR